LKTILWYLLFLISFKGLTTQTFSYWEKTAFIDNADAIIIGSGIVGLNAALHLKTLDPGLKVTVLERGFLPSGASTKNAGFACFGTLTEQLSYLKKYGEDAMVKLVDYKWRGLTRLRQKLGDAAIGFEQHGGYELFFENDRLAAEEALDNLSRINNLLKPVTDTANVYAGADDKIADFVFSGVNRMIVNPLEGQLHTGKMMRALLAKAQAAGVLILNNCKVEGIEKEGGAIMVNTNEGTFKAGKVILATNAFATQLYPALNVSPGRGQVLVTKPIADLRLKGTFHFDEGYYYFRNIDKRVLFGGGRNLDFNSEQTWDFGHTDAVKNKLTHYLKEVILPGNVFEIDYWWSGIMGFGEDIAPLITQLEPGIFCAIRCNGMGVAMGTLVGEEVAELAFNN
jgi:gamma-glutamylputrescine oxidase